MQTLYRHTAITKRVRVRTEFMKQNKTASIGCKPGPRNGGGGPQTMSFVERVRKERECAKRELSDCTPQGREKIHRNNFRVSLPRCRAVRSWG